MKYQKLILFIIACLFFVSMNVQAQTSGKKDLSIISDKELKIKDFIKEFGIKISRKDLLGMIDTLAQSGKISKDDADKARKEISAMSDEQFDQATKDAIKKIPNDLTVEEGRDTKKVIERLKASEPVKKE